MNLKKENLINKTYNLWKDYGVPNYNGIVIALYREIAENLETLQGIEQELDNIRIELDKLSKKDKFYNQFIDLWEDLNNYKTKIESDCQK